MFDSVLNTPLELFPIFATMFDWVLDAPDMLKEKQKLRKTCKEVETLLLILRNNFQEISEKNSTGE